MLESVEKLMAAGLGMLSMTREKAEEVFDDLVRRGEAAKSSREGFVNTMVNAADDARRDLSTMVQRQVDAAAERLDLATRKDLARIERKIDQLNLRQNHSPQSARKTAAPRRRKTALAR
ncbi:MAG: phasin family protein [Planctomycetaceae bacterium]|nr:phasin family protein [Planctomycetaceae bacterium]